MSHLPVALPRSRFSVFLSLLIILLCIVFASVSVHGYIWQHDGENDFFGNCCALGIASARADVAHNDIVEDQGATNFMSSVTIPIEVDQALNLTLGDILDEAKQSLKRFKALRSESDLFLGLDSDADNRIIHQSGVLIRKFSKLIAELQEAGDIAVANKLSNQAEDIRRGGIRLFLAARRLHLLMDARDHCGYRHLGIFLSSIETLALEAEVELINTARDAPSLHYFFFEGQLPNVVPENGGWLVLLGANLWQENKQGMSLFDPEKRTTVATLDVYQVGADETVAVKIEPDWIADNAGRCLHLKVSNNIAPSMLRRKQAKLAAYNYLPICIPQSFDTQYKIAGFLEYRTPTQTRLLKSKSILFENPSCTNKIQVTDSLEWTLDSGGWLIDIGDSPLYEAGSSSVNCKVSDNRVNCSGYLDQAVCGQAARSEITSENSELLLEQTEWEHIFTPTAEYPVEEEHRSWALSDSVDIEQLTTEIAVTIPREEASEKTSMWFEMIIVNGGQQKELFVSPKQTILEKQQDIYSIAYDQIVADLDPGQESDQAEIRVGIDSATCPY